MCVMAKYFCTFNSIFRKRELSECINLMQLIFVANRVCADSVDILATAFTLFRIYPIFCFCSTEFAQSTEVQKVYFYAAVCFSFSCTRLLHTCTQLCCCCHCLQHKPFTAVICNWHLEQYPFFTNLLQQYSYLDSKFVLFRHMCYKVISNLCSKFYKVILHLWRIGFAFIQWKNFISDI